MVDIDKLCPGCMQHLKDSNTTCPHCGYPEKHLTVKDSLPVFSILAGNISDAETAFSKRSA